MSINKYIRLIDYSKSLRILLILTLLTMIYNHGYAQTVQKEVVPMNKMMLEQWTAEDGLVSNNLTSVLQTSDGFLWVTSFSGVFRFNGKTFSRFYKDNIPALKTNGFLKIIETDEREYIFASQGSGAFDYTPERIEPIDLQGVSSVRSVLLDSHGKKWFGTTNEGVLIQSKGQTNKADFDLLNGVSIMSIYEDTNKDVWVGTGGNGLIKYVKDEFRSVKDDNLGVGNTITVIVEYDENQLLIGCPVGLFLYNIQEETSRLISGFDDVDVNDIKIDSSGMIWVATELGLYRTHLDNGYFEIFNEKNGLPGNKISGIEIDPEGNIWLATRKDGLLRLTEGAIVMINQWEGIVNTKINVVYEYEDEIYIGCDDGAAYVKNDKGITPIDLSFADKGLGIRDFHMAEDGSLWVGSYAGLINYKNGKERLFTKKDGLPADMIRRIVKGDNNELWLATRTGGILHFKGPGDIEGYTTANGLQSNYTLALEKDRNGDMVVGTHSGGFSIIKKDTVISHFIPREKSALVFNLHIDEDNTYWLCTNIGLYVFKDGEIRKIEFTSSLKFETFFDFIDDEVGHVWLTSNYGLVKVPKSDLDLYLNDGLMVVGAQVLDNNDGMTTRECTAATRSLLTSMGEVWIPTIDGIAVIDPKIDKKNNVVPGIFITSFEVDGETIIQNKADIDPGKVRYQFEYASTSYQAPDKVRFKYQLLGIDKDWVETSQAKIEYTNLYPGTYTFSVIGANNSGVWNQKGDSIQFVVKPFFYQTWWFFALLALMIGLIIYGAWVWRVRRIKAMNQKLSKLNEELDKFVYSASHDMRAPLASMLGLVNLAKISQSTETKDQCFDMIEKSVGKLDNFIKDIIDYSRNQRTAVARDEVHIEKSLKEVVEDLRFLDEEGNIKSYVKSEVEKINTDSRRFGVVLRNIVANAFLYHDKSKEVRFIEISCQKNESNIEIQIEDNGLGMETATVKQIFKMFYRGHEDSQGSGLGLYIAKENIEKLNGKINVESTLGEGTKFTLIFPQ